MISVGIDVSKGKSTVCVLKPYGEIVISPYSVEHIESDLEDLDSTLKKLDGEIKIVMEATGIYHLPILTFLIEKGYFVTVVNPYQMKMFAKNNNFRGVKTDKHDSKIIANYGIEKWYALVKYQENEETYEELKILGRRYRYYMEMRVKAILELTHILDYTMPGIKKEFLSWNEATNKDKLADFAEKFWHYDQIKSIEQEKFIEIYNDWAKENGYRQSREKAEKVYSLASDGITTLPSSMPSTKMIILEAVTVLRTVNNSLYHILTRMKELAKTLPEYSTVRAMGGVGDVLAPKLIAEIGDIKRFHSAKALIAWAGIDPPPYESGQLIGTRRKITKKGSATLRKVGYEVMRVLKSHTEPQDAAVYQYILKKEAEGKSKKVAKVAGFNKFLRIYYARVSEVYK